MEKLTISNNKRDEIEADGLISFRRDSTEITFTTRFIKEILFDKNQDTFNKLVKTPLKEDMQWSMKPLKRKWRE